MVGVLVYGWCVVVYGWCVVVYGWCVSLWLVCCSPGHSGAGGVQCHEGAVHEVRRGIPPCLLSH